MSQIQANGITSNKTPAVVNLRIRYPDQLPTEYHPLTSIFILECQNTTNGPWEELCRETYRGDAVIKANEHVGHIIWKKAWVGDATHLL